MWVNSDNLGLIYKIWLNFIADTSSDGKSDMEQERKENY